MFQRSGTIILWNDDHPLRIDFPCLTGKTLRQTERQTNGPMVTGHGLATDWRQTNGLGISYNDYGNLP